ncbi:10720_t:CDS:2 [Acaulospora colombiana]|uniref:10720_t:CDS:1 n=1 Tax=Acaulospora colombiana TaxID=27376 RepID=A0ACA9L0Y7_9GLOM|nr:10720_t:CDS:2 [Acaulospora colombiana]
MPHATESLNLPNAPSASSPIPIPGSTTSYVRTSTSSYDPTTTPTNMSDYVVATKESANYDQFNCANFSTDDISMSLQPEGRAYYCYDYSRCCNEEINNIHDFLQHTDTRHPGLYVDPNHGIMSFDASSIYSQSRLHAIPFYSLMPAVSASHDLKISEDHNNRVNSGSHFSTSISKQKFIAEDATCDKDLILTYHQLQYPLRDPNVTATTFLGGQTSGPSSICAGYEDDDPSVLDLNSNSFHTDHDPLFMIPSPPLSLSSCPTTPVFLQSTVSSPLGLENVGIPAYTSIVSSENSATSALGQTASPSHVNCGTNTNDQRGAPTPVDPSNTGSENSTMPTLNRQSSYDSHAPTYSTSSLEKNGQNRRTSLKPIKSQSTTYGSLTIPNEKLTTERDGRRDFSSSRTTGPLKMEKPISPASTLPSNVHSAAFMMTTAKTSDQARGPHASLRPHAKMTSSIDNTTLTPFIPPIHPSPYSMTPVDGYPLVEYISGQTSSNPAMAKYQRIQPKTGISVSMADVYTDPSLGCSTGSSQGNKNSKKRGVSSSSEANKQIKRRASKSSEKPFEASHASVITDEPISLTSREDTDKYPHKCSVAGCPKVYKNANGLKYHNEHGHVPQSSNGAREKPWPCRLPDCQKAYGSKGGLTYHINHSMFI